MHDEALPAELPQTKVEVTVQDMDKLMVEYFDLLASKEEQEAKLTGINKDISSLEGKLASYLNGLGRKDYKHPRGTVSLSKKWRVNNPASDAEKRAFFDWLRERGIFDKYATVNNASLNSLYTAEREAVIESSPEDALTFSIPGIGAPKLYEGITKRKGN